MERDQLRLTLLEAHKTEETEEIVNEEMIAEDLDHGTMLQTLTEIMEALETKMMVLENENASNCNLDRPTHLQTRINPPMPTKPRPTPLEMLGHLKRLWKSKHRSQRNWKIPI